MGGFNINTGFHISAGLLLGTTGLLKSSGLYYNGLNPVSIYFARFFNLPEKVTETQLLDTTGNGRHFTLTRRNCLIGDGVAKLVFSDLPTYDLLTIVEDGVVTEKTLTSGELVLDNGKKYNYAVFSLESTEVAKFPLMEYDSDDVLPETLNCFDVIGDAACVWNGEADKANGLSWNFRYGFTLLDGVYYPAGTGVEIIGGVEYPAYHTAANQYILAPADDVAFIALDSEEQFYDSGTPVNVNLADVYSNDYVQVTGVGVITDFKVLADISNALLSEDGLYALMSEDGQYLLIPEDVPIENVLLTEDGENYLLDEEGNAILLIE